MTVKWSAFAAGTAPVDANELVGLQSGVNVRWTYLQWRRAPDGTAAAPAWSFASTTNMGLYTEFGLLKIAIGGNETVAIQSGGIIYTNVLQSRPSLATPAAASAVAGLTLGSALVGIYWGTGDPNTALTAPKGSLFIRTDGSGVANRMYVNTDASTAWTSFATAG